MFDLYSLPVPLNFKKKESYGNSTSICFSILTFLASIGIICFNFYKYFRFSKPEFTLQEQNRAEGPDISWDRNDFDMAIAIWGMNSANLGPVPMKSIAGLITNQKVSTSASSLTKPHTMNQILPCSRVTQTEDSVQKRYQEVGIGALVGNFACIDFQSPFSFGGDFLTTDYKQVVGGELEFSVDDEKYSDSSENHSFSFSYSDNLPDFTENTGYKKIFTERSLSLEFGMEYFLHIQLSFNQVVSDDNLLFDFIPERKYSFMKVESFSLQPQKAINSTNKARIVMLFDLSNIEKSYQRSYKKVDSVLADSFAVINLVFLGCKFVFRLTYKSTFYWEIGQNMVKQAVIQVNQEEKDLIEDRAVEKTKQFCSLKALIQTKVKEMLSLENILENQKNNICHINGSFDSKVGLLNREENQVIKKERSLTKH